MENDQEKWIICDNRSCRKKMWYHVRCLDNYFEERRQKRQLSSSEFKPLPKKNSDDWFCCNECVTMCQDSVLNYSRGLIFSFLNQEGYRDSIRENAGLVKLGYTKLFLIPMYNDHHTLYMRITHRLLACINGFAPPHIQHDLIWNSTANITGKKGGNLEIDLVNEFGNKFFAGLF